MGSLPEPLPSHCSWPPGGEPLTLRNQTLDLGPWKRSLIRSLLVQHNSILLLNHWLKYFIYISIFYLFPSGTSSSCHWALNSLICCFLIMFYIMKHLWGISCCCYCFVLFFFFFVFTYFSPRRGCFCFSCYIFFSFFLILLFFWHVPTVSV